MQIVDALFVTIGLDASKFTAGTKTVSGDLKRTATEAGTAAKSIQASGDGAARFFSKLRNEALLLFGVFTASSGIKGFIEQSLGAAAATGRLATVIGANIETLSAWDHAVERAGGAAGEGSGAFKGLTQTIQSWSLTGGDASFIPYFNALGVSITTAGGKMRPVNDIFLDLARSVEGMEKPRAVALLGGLGLNEGSINLLIMGRKEVEKRLAAERAIGVTTKADAEAATKLNYAWSGIGRSITRAATDVLTAFAPAVTHILNDLGGWLVQQAPAFKAWAKETGDELKKWAEEGGWDKLKEDFKILGRRLGQIVDWLKNPALPQSLLWLDKMTAGVGGLTGAIEILFALWLGSKFLGVMGAMGRMAAGLGLLGAGIVALNLLPKGADPKPEPSGEKSKTPYADGTFPPLMQQNSLGYRPQAPGENERRAREEDEEAQRRVARRGYAPGGMAGRLDDWLRRMFPGMYKGVPDAPAAPGRQSAAPASAPGVNNNPDFGNPSAPRGIRNNNPLNLEYRQDQGAIRSDGRFGVYGSMEAGVAAASRQLMRYQDVHGLNTINGIINRWAPPGENNVNAYAGSVSRSMGVNPDAKINLHEPETMAALIGAMNRVENGRDIDRGAIRRGAGADPPSPATAASASGLIPPWLQAQRAIPGDAPTGARPAPDLLPSWLRAQGAAPVLLPQPMQTAPGRQSSNGTSEMHIASIVINTAATDAKGIMRDLGDEMARYGWIAQADRGLA